MVEEVIRKLFAILCWSAIFISTARSHQLDEYVQATLVEIEPSCIRLSINLTPGVEIADRVLKLIDADSDGSISQFELIAYAELLTRDLSIRLDGRDVELQVAETYSSETNDLKEGWGIIQCEYIISPIALSPGAHKFSFANRHMRSVGVYLFNAARPISSKIQISKQHRNTNQSNCEIDFNCHPSKSDTSVRGILFPATIFIAAVCICLRFYNK